MLNQAFDYGVTIRTSRLFNKETGRCVAVAVDHGVAMGAVAGLENLGERLEQVLAGKPEGILVNPGALRRFGYLLTGRESPAVILAVDFPLFANFPGGDRTDGQVPTISAEEAARLGADMVKICLIFGQEQSNRQIDNMAFAAATIESCHRLGIPVMIEPTTWGLRFEGKPIKDFENIGGYGSDRVRDRGRRGEKRFPGRAGGDGKDRRVLPGSDRAAGRRKKPVRRGDAA